ncbi:cytochrome f [Thermosynechococcus vestitus]|uniref:Cytochrome f n=2 Tax=Cyanophyceae TaxID=3028117 RepID=CYF_THEVB|nr:apocytochrome f [Thermosynechococcus vestitus]P0C8N4.1 RecName: Full=Cytochrome f; Flags: Precursor [Synechococcus elongatus]P0C8N5.1 RecName: Full=Cytochrome f; Flags: Precursor [Thermosynechococcus vestitus BP-1]BAC08512.1 apocytochrome f [Thermosynechococcus vestitus BP-1]CAB46650.1 apocytochrome f precursor [Synechococcus elongatus]
MKHFFKSLTLAIALAASVLFWSPQAQAYPFYAQQGYESPREATGRIVCANCHLAAKPIQVEVPQAVTPDSVFEAVVKIPYDTSVQQVLGDGSKGGLNVGAVLMLPEGFKIAPPDRLPEELQAKTSGIYYQPYSDDQQNIILVGPLPGEQYQEIVFPILAPNPGTDKSIHFGKYAVHAGGNRGRGQVYPNGEKSNNNVFTAPIAGTITSITPNPDGSTAVVITPENGEAVTETVPAGPELIVREGQTVVAGAALTNNPNVGGFGQKDTEIVLQDPNRIKWLLVFFAAITLSQILLVLKKKQVEKVQAAEMSF